MFIQKFVLNVKIFYVKLVLIYAIFYTNFILKNWGFFNSVVRVARLLNAKKLGNKYVRLHFILFCEKLL